MSALTVALEPEEAPSVLGLDFQHGFRFHPTELVELGGRGEVLHLHQLADLLGLLAIGIG